MLPVRACAMVALARGLKVGPSGRLLGEKRREGGVGVEQVQLAVAEQRHHVKALTGSGGREKLPVRAGGHQDDRLALSQARGREVADGLAEEAVVLVELDDVAVGTRRKRAASARGRRRGSSWGTSSAARPQDPAARGGVAYRSKVCVHVSAARYYPLYSTNRNG